ncbi:hypothetical protein IF655_20760 [Streptomyces sp. DSM 110735]|uniref:hypothetical protein n=1 Tax=Streptomyces sp. DSM 110735 TaxID=2775031 RepID=UPI0018F2ECE9|nr:hypothetical protein [Streptomyces sp. DSM 110735]MBJ7905719.1 hypothetical protein [Streptomyces sp. DSM 110735]
MSLSPGRRRRKPRHARPRRMRLVHPCPVCVVEALEAATGPAGQSLFTHPSEHWLSIAMSAGLLLLRVVGRRCPHVPRTHDRPALETERPQDSGAREALDVT